VCVASVRVCVAMCCNAISVYAYKYIEVCLPSNIYSCLYMYVYIHIHIYIYIHIRIYYIYVYICIYIYICMYIYLYTDSVFPWIQTCRRGCTFIDRSVCTCVGAYVCICLYTRMCACIYICIYVCMYAYTYLYTQIRILITQLWAYEVATISRLLKIIGLFCNRAL